MKHLDLFSGYGGFTIPASKYGIETINFSEIDKYATAVLKYRFPSIKNLGDITKIKPEDLPDVDIITGGSPCQDLSVAGKGAGLNGERSGLFFHFIRLIKEKQPMYFVWENVKGALSSSKGWDFARVQIEMEQAGYDVFWQLINAKDFGVPQNRERIFAIGIRRGSGREILFEQISSGEDSKTREQVSSTIHAGYYKQGGRDQQYINKIVNTGHDGTNIYGTDGIAPTQKALGGGQGAKTGLYAVRPSGDVDKRKYSLKDESGTLSSNPTSDNLPMVAVDLYSKGEPTFTKDVRTIKARYTAGVTNRKGDNSGVIVHNLQPRSPNRPSLLKNKNAGGSGHLQREDGITYTVDTGCTVGVQMVGSTQKNAARMEDISPALTKAMGDGGGQIPMKIEDMRIRRLTPTECERLMGLEDGWTARGIIDGKEVDISDTQRYKMCGNGVVVNCVDYIYSLIKLSYI